MNRPTEQSISNSPIRLALCASAACAVLLAMTACGEKKSEAPAPIEKARTETAAAPAPETDTSDASNNLDATPEPSEERRASRVNPLKDLDLDPKVEFPMINQPSSRDIAEAVASLSGAIASGDSKTLYGMLDEPSKAILDDLVEAGVWEESTNSLTKVRVSALEEDDESIRVGLGIEDANGAYLLGWSGERVGGGWLFAGIALETPAIASTAAGLDSASLAARDVPEPGAIIEDEFDPTLNDPRREQKGRRGGKRKGNRRNVR